MTTTHTAPDATATTVPDRPMLINGQWVTALDGEWSEVLSPGRRGTILARVPVGRPVDADRTVAAAGAAFPAWRALHFKDRQKALLRIADALEEHAEELALLTAADTGNALRTQARPESQSLVNLFRYFGGVAGEFKGAVLPAGDDQLQYTRREPLGVVAGILPWNSPLMIAGMKTPASLAAGNTLVLKTAQEAPLTILRMAEIASEFLPDGVLNVVTGRGSDIGEAFLVHPGVDKVSFTGSTNIGRRVGEAMTNSWPRWSTRSSNSRSAIRWTMPPTWARSSARKQFDSVQGYIDEGKAQPGVQVALDGSDQVPAGLDGFYHGPTILAGVDNTWRIAQEEIFGPVLVAIPWRDRDEVIAMANDSHFGLGAYIWTQNLTDALDTAHRVESGWIQVNQGGGQVIGQSYGGYKTSGIGREFSLEGALESFTQIKQINVKLG